MKKVAVLMGGLSAEREVSLTSGAAVQKALEEMGYKVTAIDAGSDLASQLQKAKPDVVFNALHGRFGEDGCVQGVLELMAIPYTHSGVLASALAMDKPMAKQVFRAQGLQTPEGRVVHRDEMLSKEPMPRPYVVKPINEGSSVGVMIIREEDNQRFDSQSWPFGEWVLVEPYIKGREVQVAVLDGEALGAIEIKPLGRFYDYEAKYTAGKAEHIMPAPLSPERYAEVCRYAEQAHAALGCRGLTRSDFRYDEENAGKNPFYLLEVNTQPGMTPLSLSPEIAAHKGISFNQLVQRLLETATLDNQKPAKGQAYGENHQAREAV
jgi:D-alanine-D-alanine ligase